MNTPSDLLELEIITAQLSALPASEWLPSPASVQVMPLCVGTYHRNFLVRCEESTCVARSCTTSQWGLRPEDQLAQELSTLHAVEASGVTPKPIALVKGDRPLLIESFIDGKPFTYGAAVDDVASAIAAVHRCAAIEHPGLPTTDPTIFLLQDGTRWLAYADATGRIAKEARTLLRQYEAALVGRAIRNSGSPVIVHTDLIHSNILITSDGCRIVDWEGARIGPPAWDLAYFLSPVTLRWAPQGVQKISQEQRERFIRRYADETEADRVTVSESIASLMPFVVFRALAWCQGFASSQSIDRTGRLGEFTAPEFIASLGFLFEQCSGRRE